MNFTWKWLARIVFGKLHNAIDSLTEEDLIKIADYVNKKIGGNKKVEYKSLKIIIEVAQAVLDVVRL